MCDCFFTIRFVILHVYSLYHTPTQEAIAIQHVCFWEVNPLKVFYVMELLIKQELKLSLRMWGTSL